MAKHHFDLDREKSLQAPITFTAQGKTFECVEITDELMDDISAITEDETLQPGEVLARQLALFTGEKPEAFDALSFRQRGALIDFITNAITDPFGRRQRRGAGRK